jgi:para-aminobenzoate synthetase component 1
MKPIASEVQLDCSPLELATAFCDRNYFAFLDSSRDGGEQGQHSMLAWNPVQVLRKRGTDPFPALDRVLRAGVGAGSIGYFSYDLFQFLEKYPHARAADDLNLPDCCLALYDSILLFDHIRNLWSIQTTSEAIAEKRLSEIQHRLAISAPALRASAFRTGSPEANMTRRDYIEKVRKALQYIAAGDIYQVNLAQRFRHGFEGSPFCLFANLRRMSPSYYGAYLNCGDHVVISSSPELFLQRTGSHIETRPIKGTRPRGITNDEDLAMEADLLRSKKEAAELTMIVDLERNDLGRVCEYGSIEVSRHRYIERLPNVLHTVSTVRGKLRDDVGVVDILRAAFPGGSISGCPKIRAIEIIDELEPVRRHVYTGAIGFIGQNGDLTLNIAIRTMTVTGNRVYYHAGSGIVADSIPEQEYEETLQKAIGMQQACRSSASL